MSPREARRLRCKRALEARREGKTLAAIGGEMGLSRERVRQLSVIGQWMETLGILDTPNEMSVEKIRAAFIKTLN
jgi:hypothetical protein